MSIPAALEDWNKCEDYERQCDKRQQHVSDENWKINPGEEPSVAGRLFANVHVINDVACQKTGRRDERGNHARDVSLPDVTPDPEPTRGNENRADGIERCVEGREIVY